MRGIHKESEVGILDTAASVRFLNMRTVMKAADVIHFIYVRDMPILVQGIYIQTLFLYFYIHMFIMEFSLYE